MIHFSDYIIKGPKQPCNHDGSHLFKNKCELIWSFRIWQTRTYYANQQ